MHYSPRAAEQKFEGAKFDVLKFEKLLNYDCVNTEGRLALVFWTLATLAR